MMELSPEERASGHLHPKSLSAAIQQLQLNGYVVIERVLSADFVAQVHKEHEIIFNRYLKNPDPTFGKNHYRTYLPFRAPFCDERIVANAFALPILDALLGMNYLCHYLASNTCTSGSELQPPHSDIYPLFPGSDVKPPPYHMVVNFPLVDVTDENGPIEFWAGGTHYSTYSMEEITRLAPTVPSQYATMPAGSLFIRDGRMWHRGTQNLSPYPRPNIALVYTRPWLDAGSRRIGIPQKTYDGLSERAKAIFKQEHIGGALDEIP